MVFQRRPEEPLDYIEDANEDNPLMSFADEINNYEYKYGKKPLDFSGLVDSIRCGFLN